MKIHAETESERDAEKKHNWKTIRDTEGKTIYRERERERIVRLGNLMLQKIVFLSS